MDQLIKKQWVEALRSGKYPQGRRYLKGETGFCCLGVLADVIDPEGWSCFNTHIDLNLWRGSGSSIPEDILGIRIQDRLVDLNDKERLPFPLIADWIEKNVPVNS
jgi:hypothetical protein